MKREGTKADKQALSMGFEVADHRSLPLCHTGTRDKTSEQARHSR